MMKKSISLFLLLATALFIESCSYSYFYPQANYKAYNAIVPGSVKLYAGRPNAKFEVIGSIFADHHTELDKAVLLLKKRAAENGANAVMDLKFAKIDDHTSTRIGLQGTAIRVLE